ncbi:tetratricopeptide repeat protein [Streptomyces sp. Tu102]|uniref:tetratricopeptide repeat protein n=1 Tax=Streptomyces sp. Tu102 TaxID=2838019 RepID=UPI001BDD0B57|nr:tetratricopeptide repeat protein [Streptomyces sp. Tu102]MBT1092425.1 tetratricopeptide repeat protein [Streptomyces sp. Tu102]
MSGSVEASGDGSIAAGGSIRQALTGDGAVAHYVETSLTLPPEALELPPEAPSNMVNLPGGTGLFIGRERELARLDAAFEDAGGVVVQAVHGLGGIGKSTLAAKWAAGRTGSYNPVWWITAGTPDDLESGLADLAVALQPALRDVLSPQARSEQAVRWLAEREGWLLVLDNVSDPADVRQLLGRTTGGRFLITTRRASGWHGIAEPLSLDVLEPPQAVELFGRINGGTADGVEELCAELGCLPLAVEQAAAYCAEARITPGAYRELLARRPERVFASAAEGADGEQTVARVWRVTMDRLADTPVAERVLRVIAWWAPDGIPRAYLEPLADAPDVTEALRRLAAHSMISLREDGTLSVHRLVQAVARAAEGAEETYDEAARLLVEQGLPCEDDTVWMPHVATLVGYYDMGRVPPELWVLVPMYIGDHARSPAEAIELYQRALERSERYLGPRSRITVVVRRRLADCCWAAGDHDRAARLLSKNLTAAYVLFGHKAPETIETGTALARLKLQRGDLGGGLAQARVNAQHAERTLGEGSAEALRAHAVVAEAWRLKVRAKPKRSARPAVTEIERLLEKAVRAQGEAGEAALHLMWTLGEVRETAGDLAGAIRVTEEYLRRRPVPDDGADTQGLLARERLDGLLRKSGEPDAPADGG